MSASSIKPKLLNPTQSGPFSQPWNYDLPPVHSSKLTGPLSLTKGQGLVSKEPTVIDWGPCGVRNMTGMCHSLCGGEKGNPMPLF